MLRKSRQSFEDLYDSEDDDDSSSQDGGKNHSQSGEVDNLSEFSELLVATEQAQNPITSNKLLRAYNEQGNYSVR